MLVGITSVNQSQIDQFIEDTGITYPILQDESTGGGGGGPGGFGGVTYDDYYIPNQGSPYPRDFIVDETGILVYANNEMDTDYMIYVIDELLDGEDIVKIQNENYFLDQFNISPAFPNPFNPITNIGFNVENAGTMEILVFDSRGRFISELLNQKVSKGYNYIQWNASNRSSGVYFLKFQLDEMTRTQKVVLIK